MDSRYSVCKRFPCWKDHQVNLNCNNMLEFQYCHLIHLCSVKELSLMVSLSCQVFMFARKKEPVSDHSFSLMCQSASYVLYVVAKLDELTTNNIDSVWQQNDRSKVFNQMKEAIHEWIVRKDVIGGSMFGGSVPQYGNKASSRKNRGKRELEVCSSIYNA